MLRILVALCLCTLGTSTFTTSALAAESASSAASVSIPISDTQPKKEKKFSINADLSTDSNMRDETDPAYAAGNYLYVVPSYKITRKATLSLKIGVEQKRYGDQATELSDGLLSLSRDPINIGGDRALNLTAFGYLPTNEVNRLDNTYQGGAGLSVGITQSYAVLRQAGSLTLTLSGLKNAHEFETTANGEANLSYRGRVIAVIGQSLGKHMAFEATSYYQVGRAYTDALRTLFHLEQKLSFLPEENIEVYVSHANEGSALKANGIDSNVQLYDQAHSVIGAGVAVTY